MRRLWNVFIYWAAEEGREGDRLDEWAGGRHVHYLAGKTDGRRDDCVYLCLGRGSRWRPGGKSAEWHFPVKLSGLNFTSSLFLLSRCYDSFLFSVIRKLFLFHLLSTFLPGPISLLS